MEPSISRKAVQREGSELKSEEMGSIGRLGGVGHGPCSGQREKSVQRNDPGEKQCVWSI